MFFEQKDVHFGAYVVDNIPYFYDKNLEALLSKLQVCAIKLLEWFSNNYMKINFDKCHLICQYLPKYICTEIPKQLSDIGLGLIS